MISIFSFHSITASQNSLRSLDSFSLSPSHNICTGGLSVSRPCLIASQQFGTPPVIPSASRPISLLSLLNNWPKPILDRPREMSPRILLLLFMDTVLAVIPRPDGEGKPPALRVSPTVNVTTLISANPLLKKLSMFSSSSEAKMKWVWENEMSNAPMLDQEVPNQ